MNKKLRYVGLLAVLPLFLVVLTPDFIGEADAQKAKGSPGSQFPKSYGSSTEKIVCGDKLCSELEENSVIPVGLES